MRRAFSLAWLAVVPTLVAAPEPAMAQKQRCPSVPDPEFRLDVKRPAPAIVRQRSSAELRNMSAFEGHDATLGLYASQLKTSMRLNYQMREQSGTTCLSIADAEITIAYAERTIYVARELQPGTCSYDVTLDHERRHARTDDEVLDSEIPRLKRALIDAVRKIDVVGPIPSKSVAAERDALGRTLQQTLEKATARMEEVRRTAQGKLDTPDAYRRDNARCPGGLRLK